MKDGSFVQSGAVFEKPRRDRLSSLLSVRLARLRRNRTYDIAIRVLGSGWFLLLAVVVAKATFAEMSRPDAMASYAVWALLLSRLCLVAFYLILWGLIITRPPAVAQSDGILPSLAAFVGTCMPWSISIFGNSEHSAMLNILSAICLIAGMLLTVYTVLSLGRAFSLVPQARRVVQVGPYRWIKHPLYLSEEIAVLGAVLQFVSPGALVLLFVHIAVQIRRILYEEELLRRTLPEYGVYESSRWRLIPGVW
jgi:protein-S-isoprenylcysteine O-methyltransferase Ste14